MGIAGAHGDLNEYSEEPPWGRSLPGFLPFQPCALLPAELPGDICACDLAGSLPPHFALLMN